MTKIERVETFLVAPRWLFVRVETESGIVGWGEATCEGRSETVRTAVEQLSELLIGRDALRIEDHWQVMTKGSFYRGGPILASAVSGLDQALWDIAGKRYGAPVHQLLGGPVRDRIRVYGWVGGDEPAEVADHIREQVEAGLTAVKMNASGRMSPVATVAEIDGVVERVAAAREVLGHHGDVAVDFHGRFTLANAKRVAPLLEPYRPFFLEEPVVPENSHLIGEFVRSTTTPVSTGERLYSRQEFLPVLQAGHRGRAAGPVPRRRHHRGAQDRLPGRGLRRPAGAALPARPAGPGGLPPGRLRHAQLPDPGAEHRHPLQPGRRGARLRRRPRRRSSSWTATSSA